MRPTVDILGLTSSGFLDAAAKHGVRRDIAIALYRAAFREGRTDVPWIGETDLALGAVTNEGDVRKFTLRGPDGLETESVILPQRSRVGRPRHSLCVSSQIGCALGCTFCETAQMGLRRDLTPAEIVGQWYAARFALDAPISHIVFMGMGEPLDNVSSVIRAIEVLVDPNGAAIAPSRISVSTVGHATGMQALAQLASRPGFRQLRLAVSLNAPNDAIRSTIMPINRAVPMAALREAMLAWPGHGRLALLVGYVLIPGVNDDPACARELCAYLKDVHCTINVIPYNPRRDSPWPAPRDAAVDAFIDEIRANGGFVKRRRTMGRSVMGACGQLGNRGGSGGSGVV